MRARFPVLTSGPWRPEDGDPDKPSKVLGIPVEKLLATRRDAPGALVRLTDRRYALTGSIAVVGTRGKLERCLRRRGRASFGDEWFEELRRLLRRSPRGPA